MNDNTPRRADDEFDRLDEIEETRGQPGDYSPTGETFVHDEGPMRLADEDGNQTDAINDPKNADKAASDTGGGSAEDDSIGRGEGIGESKATEGLSQGQIVRGRFLRHKGAVFGMITFATVALLSILTVGLGPIPGLWKHQDPQGLFDIQNSGKPTMHLPKWLGGQGFAIGDFPFGQDIVGHDNFTQVMAGVQTSLIVMLVLAVVVLLLGVSIGSIAGYFRGRTDMILMRLTDAVITLPVIVIGAVLGKLVSTVPAKLGDGDKIGALIKANMPILLAVALGCLLWPGLARLLRSEFLSLREREFVDSARVAGASDFRIITKHMLPNAMGIIIVNITLLMSSAVILETALSYLGFGIDFPDVSLGNLISVNQGAFATRPWLFWWPGLFIILLALSVNFIGDGLRDAFDPRTKRIPSARQMAKAFAKTQNDRQPVAAEGAK